MVYTTEGGGGNGIGTVQLSERNIQASGHAGMGLQTPRPAFAQGFNGRVSTMLVRSVISFRWVWFCQNLSSAQRKVGSPPSRLPDCSALDVEF